MGFTVQDGLAFVQGVRGVEDNRRAREDEQKEKDIDSGINLLDMMGKAKDEGTKNQYEMQFMKLNPSSRIKAVAQTQAMKQDNYKTKLTDFKAHNFEAMKKIRAASTFMLSGQTQEAMDSLASVLTSNIPNGNKYKVVKRGDKWNQEVYNSKGELIQTNVVEPKDLIEQSIALMRSPGNAFDFYMKELKALEMANANNMMEHKTYINKETGEEVFVWEHTGKEGGYNQIVQDSLHRPVEGFNVTDYELKKTDKEKLAEDKLRSEISKNKAIASSYGKAGAVQDLSKRKWEDKEIDAIVSRTVDANLPEDTFVNRKTGIVYTEDVDEFGTKVERKDSKATKARNKAFNTEREKIRKGKKKDESEYEAARRMSAEIGPGVIGEGKEVPTPQPEPEQQTFNEHCASIKKVHPDYQKLINSGKLHKWISTFSDSKRRRHLKKLLKTGNSKQIITMLNAFKEYQKVGSKKGYGLKAAPQENAFSGGLVG